jgi:hypothetical protein
VGFQFFGRTLQFAAIETLPSMIAGLKAGDTITISMNGVNWSGVVTGLRLLGRTMVETNPSLPVDTFGNMPFGSKATIAVTPRDGLVLTTKAGEPVWDGNVITVTQLKTLVAGAADWAAFKTAVEAL